MLCQNNVLVQGCILCSFIRFLRIVKFSAVVIFNRNFLYIRQPLHRNVGLCVQMGLTCKCLIFSHISHSFRKHWLNSTQPPFVKRTTLQCKFVISRILGIHKSFLTWNLQKDNRFSRPCMDSSVAFSCCFSLLYSTFLVLILLILNSDHIEVTLVYCHLEENTGKCHASWQELPVAEQGFETVWPVCYLIIV